MFKPRVCFAKRKLFNHCYRQYTQRWYASMQINKKMAFPAINKNNLGTTSYMQPFPWHLCMSAGSKLSFFTQRHFSKFPPSNAGDNINNMQKYVQKYSFSNNQQALESKTAGTAEQDWGPYILNRIHTLEESSRFHGYNILRWGISGMLLLCTFVYLFRDQLRDNVADEVADVASRSMADENVVLKAHGMTKDVLERLVSEPETITLVTDFIQEVMQKESLRKTAVCFAVSVINHPDTQEEIQVITRNTIHAILNNTETKYLLLSFIKDLINDDQTREACQQLLINLTKDHDIQQIVSNFFQSVLASPDFQTEAALLGREVTNKVVNDQQIQKETGDALWSAVKYGITPHWFRGS